jgi:hypothetical protein
MTREEFDKLIYDKIKTYPDNWREGQKIFNAAEEILWKLTQYKHNIAREVQFEDNVDCFYDNSKIKEFLNKCWNRFSSL